LVSIHKKGDPADMDNYRDISLIPVPFKLLLTMITIRVQKAMEQAGFRAKEECPGQAAALVEMVQAQEGKHWNTHLLDVCGFISKAYDTVPHEALFGKMYQWGIRGKMLEFVKALYASSTVAVQMAGYTSDPFLLLRGLRQGCPFSPVLFDIFHNGWLGKTWEAKVRMWSGSPWGT